MKDKKERNYPIHEIPVQVKCLLHVITNLKVQSCMECQIADNHTTKRFNCVNFLVEGDKVECNMLAITYFAIKKGYCTPTYQYHMLQTWRATLVV